MTINYKKIIDIFNSKNCELLTTEDEYNDLIKNKVPSLVSFKYIASCGHENNIVLISFKLRNLGIICRKCKNKEVKNNAIEISKKVNYIHREIDFTKKFQIFISDKFESKLTNEGAKTDLIIKPINIKSDKWLCIQIKTTQDICHNVYAFTIQSNYANHIIICHCINDDKYWLIPFNDINTSKISIGKKGGSKYIQYYTEKNDIKIELLKYYNNTDLYLEKDSIISANKSANKEELYRQKIYNYCSFLNIEKPQYTNMVFDLIINNKKIQEKVINQKENGFGYTGLIFKRFGCRKVQNYNCYDNDFYWFHVSDTSSFFIIPEFELYEKDIISLLHIEGKKGIYLHLDYNVEYKHNWAYKYLFDYENIDKEKLLNILNNDYNDYMNSVIYNKMMDM